MTGPGQPVSDALQKARQRLLRLGLTDDHILSMPTPANEAFDLSHLDPQQADPHFNVIVQRVVRFLRGGRGLSIAITDDGLRGDARVHTAVQLAGGLTRHGIHVVVVDMDLQNPGLHGLIPDTQSEGLIDMVRFGRSCRSVLQKPHASGPSLLSAGSFPVQEPLPLDEDAIRSVLHRVSLHCELALYVAPLLPDGNLLNPVVRLCEHVVLVQSVSDQSVDVVQRIQLMQQARLHVAGVVLFEGSRPAAPEPQKWLPGSLYSESAPGTAAGIAATAAGAVTPDAGVTPPLPESPAPAVPSPESPVSELSLSEQVPPAPPQEPPRPEPPTSETTPPELVQVPAPHIAWKGRQPEPLGSQTADDKDIPEIHLPDEETSVGPYSSPRQPFASTAAEPKQPMDAVAPEEPVAGAEAIERLWTEPAQSSPDSAPSAASSTQAAEDQPFSEHPGTYARGSEAYARGETEQVDIRMTDFDTPEYEDSETEFAYDDGNNWSRTPLYILVTLLVLVGGFFGWALWTKRGIEQQVGQQLLDTDWIDAPQSTEGAAVPDDAAAVPQNDAALPSGGLKGMADAKKGTEPPSRQPAATDAGTEKKPAVAPATTQPPPTRQPASSAGKDATEEMAPVRVPPRDNQDSGGAVEKSPGSTAGATDANYTVHVGSFRHLEQAYKEIAVLQKRGYTGRAVRTDLGNKGIWYRVYVGGFNKRSEAEQARDRILELPEYNYAQVKRLP